MALHYEVVFACFLRDDTPAETLDLLRWHLGIIDEDPPGRGDDHPERLLAPDPASALPGGDVALLEHQLLPSGPGVGSYAWGLFARTRWSDERMYAMSAVMELVAPHVAEAGYGGYFRQDDTAEATAFTFAAPAVSSGDR